MENGVLFYEQAGALDEPNQWLCTEQFTLKNLGSWRLTLKLSQVIVSFLAFVAEEAGKKCNFCAGLYIFEFVSCSAFILGIAVMVLYCTALYEKAGEERITCVDFFVATIVGMLFFLASIIFSVIAEKQLVENTATALGFCASTLFLVDAAQIIMKHIVEVALQDTIPTVRNHRCVHRERRLHERCEIQMLSSQL